MVIKNSTSWRTDDLRMLFRRAIKEVEKIEKPNRPFHKINRYYHWDILNSSSGLRGRARLNGYWMMIKIPKKWIIKTEMPVKEDAIIESGKYRFNSISGSYSWITLDNPKDISKYPHYWKVVGELDEMEFEHKKELGRTIIHEYYHNLGAKTQDAQNYRNDWTKNWNVDWVKDYPICKKPIILKPQVDIKLMRYQRAIKNLRRAETRLSRAKTLYKKWFGKVKRYEKVYNFKVAN